MSPSTSKTGSVLLLLHASWPLLLCALCQLSGSFHLFSGSLTPSSVLAAPQGLPASSCQPRRHPCQTEAPSAPCSMILCLIYSGQNQRLMPVSFCPSTQAAECPWEWEWCWGKFPVSNPNALPKLIRTRSPASVPAVPSPRLHLFLIQTWLEKQRQYPTDTRAIQKEWSLCPHHNNCKYFQHDISGTC